MVNGFNRGYPEVAFACLIYGMTGIFLTYIHDMSVGSIMFYRMLFGIILITFFLLISNKISLIKLKGKKKYLLLQGIFMCVTMFSYLAAVKYTSVSIAVLMQYTAPIYVTIASPFLLKESITRSSIVALIVGFLGILLVVRPEGGFSQIDFNSNYMIGIIFGLIAGISYAGVIMNVGYLKHDYPEITIVFWAVFVSTILLLPFALKTSIVTVKENFSGLFFFGSMSIAVAEVIMIDGFAKMTAQTGSILALIEPASGIFIDLTLFGVSFHLYTISGCLLIILSALMVSFQDHRFFKWKLNFYQKN